MNDFLGVFRNSLEGLSPSSSAVVSDEMASDGLATGKTLSGSSKRIGNSWKFSHETTKMCLIWCYFWWSCLLRSACRVSTKDVFLLLQIWRLVFRTCQELMRRTDQSSRPSKSSTLQSRPQFKVGKLQWFSPRIGHGFVSTYLPLVENSFRYSRVVSTK